MSLPGAGAVPTYMPNPKSILADKSQNALFKTNYLNNTRVTFAQAALNRKRNEGGSSTNVNQTPPGTAKDGRAASAGQKFPSYPNKYNFGIFQTGNKNKFGQTATNASIASSGRSDASTAGEVEKGKKSPAVGRRSAKNVSVLYPANNSNKFKSAISPGSSTGLLVSKSKSVENAVTSAKSTSVSRVKKMTRSLTSSLTNNVPRRTKSGKKLLKKRKSKSGDQLDKDLESVKPAHLNEEYAAELNKIKEILKAVTAFDESTATEDGSINYVPTSKKNLVTQYRYTADASSITVASGSLSRPSTHVHRPLSADELKQLLSSITRVVSLHQLPVNIPPAKGANNNTRPTTFAAGTASPSPPISVDGYRPHPNLDSLWEAKLEESLANDADTRSSSKPKKKKSRKFVKPSISKSRSEVGKTKPAVSASPSSTTSKGKAYRKKSRPKYKSERQQKAGKTHSRDSVSDTDKDPVKNALFLRRYFEESIRLANKKSSDELLTDDHDEEDNKSKKKSKKKSVTKKASTKNTTRKTQKKT